MLTKKEIRQKFRDETYLRDKYKCRGCGLQATPGNALQYLDAHHITPREEMPNGGYVKENGISLCNMKCHMKAEMFLKGESQDSQFSPKSLYKCIGSSRELAEKKAAQLNER